MVRKLIIKRKLIFSLISNVYTIVSNCMDREKVDTLDLSIAVTDQNTISGQNASTSKFKKTCLVLQYLGPKQLWTGTKILDIGCKVIFTSEK